MRHTLGRLAGPMAILAGIFWPASDALAERVELEVPVGLSVRSENQTIGGRVFAYDDIGFELRDRDDQPHAFEWVKLGPAQTYQISEKLIDKRSAPAWRALSSRLAAMEGGEALAQRARQRAERLDPQSDVEPAPTDPDQAQADKTKGDPSAPTIAPGPQESGEIEEKYWGKLTDEQMAQAVNELKQFAEQTQKTMDLRLKGYETDYFIFVTDLPADEAKQWNGLLDKMYDRLCDLFAVPRGTNIWRGKALVFVFTQSDDYRRFQVLMHQTDPRGSAGMCHALGDGTVHIAFYRQPSDWDFAHVLVHESVHGYLHRYRKPTRIPSWANEGLAEVIASELVPQSDQIPLKEKLALRIMKRTRTIGPIFFIAPQIDPWQYGVASSLTRYMIQQNKKGYVALINGIKDGMSVGEALNEKYGAPADRLIDFYGRNMGIDDLQ